MMAVNVPVILMSHLVGDRIPLKAIRIVSGIIFASLGVYELSKIFRG
jgi:putative Ca2+/H+ antiporter (TMEM165/GDT1 family)